MNSNCGEERKKKEALYSKKSQYFAENLLKVLSYLCKGRKNVLKIECGSSYFVIYSSFARRSGIDRIHDTIVRAKRKLIFKVV